MDNQNGTVRSFFDKQRTLIKGLFIGFLIIIMLIPTALLMNLVHEREGRQQEVVNEISKKWASEQTVTGPVLAIPHFTTVYDNDKNPKRIKKTAYILPEKLMANGHILPDNRHRSIYNVTVYSSYITLEGSFDTSYLEKMNIATGDIIYDDIKLLVGVQDVRGLQEDVKVVWGGTTKVMEADINTDAKHMQDLLSAEVSFNEAASTSFKITMQLNGTGKLYFTPVGKTSKISMSSSWKDPSFDGQYLPNKKQLSDSGFTADWRVLQVSRGFPQFWRGNNMPEITRSALGVRLIQPTDHYSKTERSVKYAILIISLTFVVFFFLEIMQKRLVHPLQYILVGIALSVFYTLLLSISEYSGFDTAYLIASVATVSLISWYVYTIFKKVRIAAAFTGALGGLYLYIYFLIQLKDYALLFGSIGLFIIIFVLMYSSRNIDWYNTSLTKNQDAENDEP